VQTVRLKCSLYYSNLLFCATFKLIFISIFLHAAISVILVDHTFAISGERLTYQHHIVQNMTERRTKTSWSFNVYCQSLGLSSTTSLMILTKIRLDGTSAGLHALPTGLLQCSIGRIRLRLPG